LDAAAVDPRGVTALETSPPIDPGGRGLNIPLNIRMTFDDALERLSMFFGVCPTSLIRVSEKADLQGKSHDA
jgi:hypothetical protein